MQLLYKDATIEEPSKIVTLDASLDGDDRVECRG